VGTNNTITDISSIEARPGFPLCIPASRLLRPYRPQELFLNKLKIRRVASEMHDAARTGKLYHLWWHPHNFGHFPEQSLRGLRRILEAFDLCRSRHKMESLTMGEIASKITAANA